MDYIFDCFFEDTFIKMERSELRDRHSRRNVLDHLNAVIGGCSDGLNERTDEVARLAVLSAIKYHNEKKEFNNKVCLMGKYHNILYIALRTCWDWGVRDSVVVIGLLDEIYKCEKTFERLFLGALFGTHAPHFIAGWRSDFNDQEENTKAMVYFLNHATSLNFKLPVKVNKYDNKEEMMKYGQYEFFFKVPLNYEAFNSRCKYPRLIFFIDIPIESCGKSSPLRVALQATSPDILLILLRYGADPLPSDGGSSTVVALLEKLIEYEDRRYLCQMVLCLQILLKNLPIIEMPFKPFLFEDRKAMFLEKYGTLLVDHVILVEQVFGVMSLRHLCRCRIRDLLRLNAQLPNGIDTLRIPRKLQRYIDLMEEL